MTHARLATRLYNAPLLLMPEKADVIERVFRAYDEDRAQELARYEPTRHVAASSLVPMRQTSQGYAITPDGVAVVDVLGSLVQRGSGMDAVSGMTGYNRLAAELDAAFRDPMVRGVVLDVDSPGGEVAGAFELAQFIADAPKPVYAVANELAASAAYLIASAAWRLFVPQTGLVGSVGVVMLHVDRSRANERAGVVYTPIYAGARKVDGSSLGPLTESARSDAQARVDKVYSLFVDAVAQRRGITPDAVRSTEAGILSSDEAKAAGFVDEVGTLGDAIVALAEHVRTGKPAARSRSVRGQSNEGRGTNMQGTQAAPAAAGQEVHEPAAIAAPTAPAAPTASADSTPAPAPAAADPAPEPVAADAERAGRAAERARIRAILTSAEASTRPALASHLALATDLAVEAVLPILAAATPEAKAGAGNLAARMPRNPGIGADAAEAGERRVATINVANIYEARAKARGAAGAA